MFDGVFKVVAGVLMAYGGVDGVLVRARVIHSKGLFSCTKPLFSLCFLK